MDAETIKTLLNLGLAGVIIVLMVTGYLIPKPFYEREVKRGDVATESTSKSADAVRDVAAALKTVTEEVKNLRVDYSNVVNELKSVKEELIRSQR